MPMSVKLKQVYSLKDLSKENPVLMDKVLSYFKDFENRVEQKNNNFYFKLDSLHCKYDSSRGTLETSNEPLGESWFRPVAHSMYTEMLNYTK